MKRRHCELAARPAAVAAVLCAAALLSGCNTKDHAGGGIPSNPIAVSGTAGSTPAQSTPAQSAPARSTSARSTSTQPTSAPSASPSTQATSELADPGCRDLVASAGVKDAVTHAYARQNPPLKHIEPQPGSFLYGECVGVTYAAARFRPTAGATLDGQVAMQDEGSVRKYLVLESGSWTDLASDGFPSNGHCAAQVPTALAAVWNGCSTP
jgi:predicted small secreted protein